MYTTTAFLTILPLTILAHKSVKHQQHDHVVTVRHTIYKDYNEHCATKSDAPLLPTYTAAAAASSATDNCTTTSLLGKPVTHSAAAPAATDDCPTILGAECNQVVGCAGGLVCCDVTNTCIIPGQIVNDFHRTPLSATTPLLSPYGYPTPSAAASPTTTDSSAASAPTSTAPSSSSEGGCATFLNAGDACDPNSQTVCCGGASACDTTTLICVVNSDSDSGNNAPAPTAAAPAPAPTDSGSDGEDEGGCQRFLNVGDACDPNSNSVCCGGDSACDTTTLVCTLPDF